MTSPLATIGLTYDAEDLQDFDLGIVLHITQGLNEAPDVRGKDVLVPGLDGQIPRPRRPHQLRLVLMGDVWGPGADTAARRSAYRVNQRFLRELFSPARDPADLVALAEDGSTWTISARPLNTIPVEQVPSEHATISVELLSIDPDWVIEEAP
jgi:hypothetical protein